MASARLPSQPRAQSRLRERPGEGERRGARRKGRRRGDTLLRPAAQQSTPSPTNTPTHPLLKGSLGVAVVAGLIFCRARGIVSFQTKARSLAREAQQLKRRTRTSLEEWHLNEGGGGPRVEKPCHLSRGERGGPERDRKLPTPGQQEVTSYSGKKQAALGERGCLLAQRRRTNARSERQRSAQSLPSLPVYFFPLLFLPPTPRETEAASGPGLKE